MLTVCLGRRLCRRCISFCSTHALVLKHSLLQQLVVSVGQLTILLLSSFRSAESLISTWQVRAVWGCWPFLAFALLGGCWLCCFLHAARIRALELCIRAKPSEGLPLSKQTGLCAARKQSSTVKAAVICVTVDERSLEAKSQRAELVLRVWSSLCNLPHCITGRMPIGVTCRSPHTQASCLGNQNQRHLARARGSWRACAGPKEQQLTLDNDRLTKARLCCSAASLLAWFSVLQSLS